MTIQAVALLKLAAGSQPASFVETRELADGSVAVTLPRPFDAYAAEEQSGEQVLNLDLGPAAQAHQDPRGVFVYPAVSPVRGNSYDAIIDEVGEAGVWVHVQAHAEVASDPQAAAFEAMRQIAAAIPPDVLQRMQQAVMQGDDQALMSLQEHLPQLEEVASLLEDLFPGALAKAGAPWGTPPVPPPDSPAPEADSDSGQKKKGER